MSRNRAFRVSHTHSPTKIKHIMTAVSCYLIARPVMADTLRQSICFSEGSSNIAGSGHAFLGRRYSM